MLGASWRWYFVSFIAIDIAVYMYLSDVCIVCALVTQLTHWYRDHRGHKDARCVSSAFTNICGVRKRRVCVLLVKFAVSNIDFIKNVLN